VNIAARISPKQEFSNDVLLLDAAAEVERIVEALRRQVVATFGRRGAVVGLSGGIDSSVVAALCVRAFGRDKVLGIFMPERHSSDDSLRLARSWAAQLGIDTVLEDISLSLEGLGAYRRQIEAIRTAVPEYDDGWRCKLVLPPILASKNRLNITYLTVQDPHGDIRNVRLSSVAYLQLVAATNFKQRVRKMLEYYHADRLNYVVAATPNRLEYDQGFFVKQGDGAADVMPIAHLYKTQVYQLAEYLDVDEEIRRRLPTTDTFSMPQSQEEFYFALPYRLMDLCLFAVNHGVSPDAVAGVVGLTTSQVEIVFKDIGAKRRATRYLHARPLLIDQVFED
jgi:NAD+ synthase